MLWIYALVLGIVLSFSILARPASGQIFVGNCGNCGGGSGTVGEYTTSGAVVNPALITGLTTPWGIAVSGDRLFLTVRNPDRVGEWTTSGVPVNDSLITGLAGPRGIAVFGTNLYVANDGSGTIGKYTTSGTVVNAALISGLNSPTDIALSDDGEYLFVVKYFEDTIGKYTTSGATVNASLIPSLHNPAGVAVSGTDLFVCNSQNGTIGKYTTLGASLNPALISGLGSPYGVAVSGGNLFVLENFTQRIGKYTTSGAAVNPLLITGLPGPLSLAVVPESPPPTPTPTATATPGGTSAQPLNLSTRMRVLTGNNVGIGGFIITGSAPKQVLLRGIGPSLAGSGVPDPLADPLLELHGPAGFSTIVNNNWIDSQQAAIQATGLAPTSVFESAILVTLNPGAYTAILKGNNNTVGVALVEAYDLNYAAASKLGNISTRAYVSTGADIVIAGFILGGNSGTDNIIVRGIGPSLAQVGVPNALANPTLELRDGNGNLLRFNNDWQDDPFQAGIVVAAGLAPTNALESAIAENLSPGAYTALLSGLNNGTGVGLVELYDPD